MTLGFYFDATHCIGCRTCQVACKDRHDLQSVGIRPRKVESAEAGSYPDSKIFHVSISCNHCADPACVKGCPTAAMHKIEDGIVVHDDSKCVLCKNCMSVCPYAAPQFDEVKSVIVKCDSCKDLREAGMNPTCVDACPMRALDFGDIDELRVKYGDSVSEIPSIAPSDWTHPNIAIKPNDAAKSPDFNSIVM